jgi:hypothetical protein
MQHQHHPANQEPKICQFIKQPEMESQVINGEPQEKFILVKMPWLEPLDKVRLHMPVVIEPKRNKSDQQIGSECQ